MGNGGPETNGGTRVQTPAQTVISGVNWQETFAFTHLFRTFRLAIHPSKLLLALAAVIICYLGGRIMDGVTGHGVVVAAPGDFLRMPADEIRQYIAAPTMGEFRQWRSQAIDANRQAVAALLAEDVEGLKTDPAQCRELAQKGKGVKKLADVLDTQRGAAIDALDRRYDQAKGIITTKYDNMRKTAQDQAAVDAARDAQLDDLNRARDFLRIAILSSPRVAARAVLKLNPADAVQTIVLDDPNAGDAMADRRKVAEDRQKLLSAAKTAEDYATAKSLQGMGVFDAALNYGILMFNSAVDSVREMEFFFNDRFKGFTGEGTPPGLVRTLGLALGGLAWFAHVHWLYFIIYGLFCLAVWSVAGGAICRIAALHATRDEKIPLKESVAFAAGKFGNFFTAPLLPLLAIAGCALLMLIIGAVAAIPWLGELLAGILFFIPLYVVGFILALMIVGAIGGLGLMYPTIAVEGSDSFDALSRSYSYVYTRPWRTILYVLVAAIYGTLCFVFVKLFVALVFVATHALMGVTMNWDAAGRAAPLGKLEAMWYSPSFSGPFFGQFYLFPLNLTERIGAFFIALWVFLLVGLVIAFTVSFFFSAYTIIYLLLRRQNDATELDEVYVREFEAQEPQGAALPPVAPAPDEPPAASATPMPPAEPAPPSA